MLNKNIAIAVVVVLAIVCLAEAREEGPHDMADALRMLQELDRYYTQAARPRLVPQDNILSIAETALIGRKEGRSSQGYVEIIYTSNTK